jgi:hypothetical protein
MVVVVVQVVGVPQWITRSIIRVTHRVGSLKGGGIFVLPQELVICTFELDMLSSFFTRSLVL